MDDDNMVSINGAGPEATDDGVETSERVLDDSWDYLIDEDIDESGDEWAETMVDTNDEGKAIIMQAKMADNRADPEANDVLDESWDYLIDESWDYLIGES